MQGGAEAEGRIRIEIHIGAVGISSIEIRSQHDANQFGKRSGLPAGFSDQPVGISKGHHASLILGYKFGHVVGISRGLREQRQELGEQVAGAMPQFADQQFVALLQLPPVNSAGDQIGDRGEE